MKVYIAGKVANDSLHKRYDWRDDFCANLAKLSNLTLENLDPIKIQEDTMTPHDIFAKDCYLISQCDAMVVYLSDDISVGGSQEILIAKYFQKPVIGLAPRGGKFNGSSRKVAGRLVHNFQCPFVFSTCDIVCDDLPMVAKALISLNKGNLKIKTIDLIGKAAKSFTTSINPPQTPSSPAKSSRIPQYPENPTP